MDTELMGRAWTRLKKSVGRKKNKQFSVDERDALQFHKERDARDNCETSPPDDETVGLHCAWAVEFYTPAHMDKLAKNLLCFNRTSGVPEYQAHHLDTWVNELHRTRYGGGWINLGLLERKGQQSNFVGPTRKVGLPPSAEYAFAHAFRVSPAIVCIAVCFVFDKEFSSYFDGALRKYRESFARPIDSGFSIFTPEVQKVEDIGFIRSMISTQFTDWYRENFPGLFSSGILEGHVPVCEFVTLRKAKPFPKLELGAPGPPLYIRLLGLDHGWDTWRHTEIPGLHFSSQRHHRGAPPRYSTLCANDAEFPNKVNKYGGHEGLFARILYLNEEMPGLLCMWAALALLDVYTESLNQVRNSEEVRTGPSDDPAKALQRLKNLISSSSEIAAVSADFCRDSESSIWTFGDIAGFIPCEPEFYKQNSTLDMALRQSIIDRAIWLRDTELSVRDQLAQLGAIINASENVRLQKTVAKLTRWIVVLTVLAVILAAAQLLSIDWKDTLQDFTDFTSTSARVLWPWTP